MLSGKLRHSYSHRAKALANKPIRFLCDGLTQEDIRALSATGPGSIVALTDSDLRGAPDSFWERMRPSAPYLSKLREAWPKV
jgi:hypothetical protein